MYRYQDENGICEPDGVDIEDCIAIHLHKLEFHPSWEDLPCAIRSYNFFICEQPPNNSKLYFTLNTN